MLTVIVPMFNEVRKVNERLRRVRAASMNTGGSSWRAASVDDGPELAGRVMNRISKIYERDETLEPVNLPPYIGFACWTMIVLFPLLYWVNGPAVSTDQLVVQTALIIPAVGGALGSRLLKRKQTTVEECKIQTVAEPEDRTPEK